MDGLGTNCLRYNYIPPLCAYTAMASPPARSVRYHHGTGASAARCASRAGALVSRCLLPLPVGSDVERLLCDSRYTRLPYLGSTPEAWTRPELYRGCATCTTWMHCCLQLPCGTPSTASWPWAVLSNASRSIPPLAAVRQQPTKPVTRLEGMLLLAAMPPPARQSKQYCTRLALFRASRTAGL